MITGSDFFEEIWKYIKEKKHFNKLIVKFTKMGRGTSGNEKIAPYTKAQLVTIGSAIFIWYGDSSYTDANLDHNVKIVKSCPHELEDLDGINKYLNLPTEWQWDFNGKIGQLVLVEHLK